MDYNFELAVIICSHQIRLDLSAPESGLSNHARSAHHLRFCISLFDQETLVLMALLTPLEAA